MQVNHLAPALLAMLLIPSLLRGSPSRIVNVNSIVSFLVSQVTISGIAGTVFYHECTYFEF